MSGQTTDRNRQDADRIFLSVPEAAERLGVTPDAVRARLHRGTLHGDKRDGQWRVFLSNEEFGVLPDSDKTPEERDEQLEPTGRRQEPTAERQDAHRERFAERYAQLERENERLWAELEARTEEIRRRDHIIAGLVERLPALTAGSQGDSVADASATQNKAAGATGTQAPASDASNESISFWCRLMQLLGGG